MVESVICETLVYTAKKSVRAKPRVTTCLEVTIFFGGKRVDGVDNALEGRKRSYIHKTLEEFREQGVNEIRMRLLSDKVITADINMSLLSGANFSRSLREFIPAESIHS